MEELIWNGLDSGSDLVEVMFEENGFGGVTAIEVRDRGMGIPFDRVNRAFGTLGQSLKREGPGLTADGRPFHGCEGRGRYRALALGAKAVWKTTYQDNGSLKTYSITLTRGDETRYDVSDPERSAERESGTLLRIENIDDGHLSVAARGTLDYLAVHLAIYLHSYPNVRVKFGKEWIDPKTQIVRLGDAIVLPAISTDHPPPKLRMVEWASDEGARRIFLCDDASFVHGEVKANIVTRDINLSAFVSYAEVPQWVTSGRIATAELGGETNDVQRLLESVRGEMRGYVRKRAAEDAKSIVEAWKREHSYPYSDTDVQTPVSEAERQVFDIVATRIHEYQEGFRKGEASDRRLTLNLLRQALESNPTELRKILEEVLGLPTQQRKELADLLERTTLAAMISAAKSVTDRLEAIEGFNEVLFNADWRKKLLERTQLHRLLVRHLWIFGDEYALDTDDEGLTACLKAHIKHLGRDVPAEDVDVRNIDGQEAIPDLMLSRKFSRDRGAHEHLIIELKRPALVLGSTEMTQIEKYALAVSKEPRFDKESTQWTFVLLGTDWDDFAEEKASQTGLPHGTLIERGNLRVLIRRWSTVLKEARHRYKFFREQLQVEVSQSEGLASIKQKHADLLEGRGLTKKQEKAKKKGPNAETGPS